MLHVTQRVYTTYLLVLGDGGRSGGVGNIVVHVEFDEQCVVQVPVRFGILFVFAVPPQHPQFVVPVREHLMPHPRPGKEREKIHAMLVLFNEFLTIMNFWRSFLTLIIFGQHLGHFSFETFDFQLLIGKEHLQFKFVALTWGFPKGCCTNERRPRC